MIQQMELHTLPQAAPVWAKEAGGAGEGADLEQRRFSFGDSVPAPEQPAPHWPGSGTRSTCPSPRVPGKEATAAGALLLPQEL